MDLAVGCGYKYLNGGPGAPAYIYVRPDLVGQIHNPIAEWFGHRTPFDFSTEFVPAHGVGRMRVGTPHILSLVALDAALAVFAEVELEQIRARSQSLTGFFIEQLDAQLGSLIDLITPRDPDRRGARSAFATHGPTSS